jgi:hypothetical protein
MHRRAALRTNTGIDHAPEALPTNGLLTSTVVGYNVDRIRSFARRMRENAAKKTTRAKRRSGTWTDVLSTASQRNVPAPGGPDRPPP